MANTVMKRLEALERRVEALEPTDGDRIREEAHVRKLLDKFNSGKQPTAVDFVDLVQACDWERTVEQEELETYLQGAEPGAKIAYLVDPDDDERSLVVVASGNRVEVFSDDGTSLVAWSDWTW